MDTESHRHRFGRKLANDDDDDDDDEPSEGEVSSSFDDDDDNDLPQPSAAQPQRTSQSWTSMLTEHSLTSIMSNALADSSEIIHIDDPIAQQSDNPLTYVFPPGTDVDEYFERKQKLAQPKATRKPNRRDLKNLAHLLNREKNEDLLRTVLQVIGCRRAFQCANEAVRLYKANDESITKGESGQTRTLGGVYFKMFLSDTDNRLISESEREEIKKRNQALQKAKKKQKRNKKSKKNNRPTNPDDKVINSSTAQ